MTYQDKKSEADERVTANRNRVKRILWAGIIIVLAAFVGIAIWVRW